MSSNITRPPHIRDGLSLAKVLLLELLVLLPALVFSWVQARAHFFFLMDALTISLAITVTGVVIVRRRWSIDPRCIMHALLLLVMLPPHTPILTAAIGMAFGVIAGEKRFGKTGINRLHPTLTAYVLLQIFFGLPVEGAPVWTMSVAIASGGALAVFLIMGLRAWRPLVGMAIGGGLPVLLLGGWMGGIDWVALAGGGLFGAVWFVSDPHATPCLRRSQWLYGLLAGGLAAASIAFSAGTPASLMLFLLLATVLESVIDDFFAARNIVQRLIQVRKPLS